MKYLYFLIASAVSAVVSVGAPSLQNQELSPSVAAIESGSNNLSKKVIALSGILVNEKLPEADRLSAAKAMALHSDSEGIEELLKSIDVTLKTTDGTKYIAVDALVIVGDRAIDPILRFLEKTDQDKQLALAVQVIVQIKGNKYQDFVNSVKPKVSPKVIKSLVIHGDR